VAGAGQDHEKMDHAAPELESRLEPDVPDLRRQI